MGLDQTLSLEITATRKTYPIGLAKEYLENINNYLDRVGYHAELNYWEESGDPNIDLEDLYDIDGNKLDRYSLANIPDVQQSLRKANQIQNYFETKFYQTNPNDQYNCVDTVLDDDDVDILLNKIETIQSQPTLEKRQTYAKKIMPTTEGFFYGDTNYDEYYFKDLSTFAEELTYLKKRRAQIEHLLEHSPFQVDMIYSSWW